MPQVPADVLSEVFSSDNPLADTITLAASGATLRCYVEERFYEAGDERPSEEVVANVPYPLHAEIATGARLTFRGADYLISSVRHSHTSGVAELVLSVAPAAA